MRECRNEFGVPALQLGVIKDGQVLLSGAIGVANLKTAYAITSRSLFHMASVSKPFVATAILQLVERKKLKLEDRVRDHLPYFQLDDKRFHTITIRQLLTHSSGLPDIHDYQWETPQYDEGAAERYVRSLSSLQLHSAPGERFYYSNPGYDILGDIISKTSGQSFELYMKKNIFNPLSMADSTFLKSEVPPELLVSPHLLGISTLFD